VIPREAVRWAFLLALPGGGADVRHLRGGAIGPRGGRHAKLITDVNVAALVIATATLGVYGIIIAAGSNQFSLMGACARRPR
jgi:hypothetical protein